VADKRLQRGTSYRIVARGELGDRLAFPFEGMDIEQVAGTTILTGRVVDQAHLLGLIKQVQELGLDLVSAESVD
jgi:hypothetical protein